MSCNALLHMTFTVLLLVALTLLPVHALSDPGKRVSVLSLCTPFQKKLHLAPVSAHLPSASEKMVEMSFLTLLVFKQACSWKIILSLVLAVMFVCRSHLPG